jgi:hypothetical protein
VKYADIPEDTTIRLAVCTDIQTAIDALFEDPMAFEDEGLIPQEAKPYFDALLNDIASYGFVITNVTVLDGIGSLLIRMENLNAKYIVGRNKD